MWWMCVCVCDNCWINGCVGMSPLLFGHNLSLTALDFSWILSIIRGDLLNDFKLCARLAMCVHLIGRQQNFMKNTFIKKRSAHIRCETKWMPLTPLSPNHYRRCSCHNQINFLWIAWRNSVYVNAVHSYFKIWFVYIFGTATVTVWLRFTIFKNTVNRSLSLCLYQSFSANYVYCNKIIL